MDQVEALRRFNRFYTRRIGVLREGLLDTAYSLPEARVLYELGARGACGASELARDLALDAGYLSRLLRGLKRRGLVRGEAASADARRSVLSLTGAGRRAFRTLDARSRTQSAVMLEPLSAAERARLAGALRAVESLLDGKVSDRESIALRPPRPGDMGWVVHRHGALYFEEYGWDERFEALVAGIAKDFIDDFDPARERCWIAELDGKPVGSVFLKKESKSVGKLRLLLVEPEARGLGLGKRLVSECVAFARAAGYRKLVLWTQSNLEAARAIYRGAGFKRTRQERHRSFGYDLTGEYWELSL